MEGPVGDLIQTLTKLQDRYLALFESLRRERVLMARFPESGLDASTEWRSELLGEIRRQEGTLLSIVTAMGVASSGESSLTELKLQDILMHLPPEARAEVAGTAASLRTIVRRVRRLNEANHRFLMESLGDVRSLLDQLTGGDVGAASGYGARGRSTPSSLAGAVMRDTA